MDKSCVCLAPHTFTGFYRFFLKKKKRLNPKKYCKVLIPRQLHNSTFNFYFLIFLNANYKLHLREEETNSNRKKFSSTGVL